MRLRPAGGPLMAWCGYVGGLCGVHSVAALGHTGRLETAPGGSDTSATSTSRMWHRVWASYRRSLVFDLGAMPQSPEREIAGISREI